MKIKKISLISWFVFWSAILLSIWLNTQASFSQDLFCDIKEDSIKITLSNNSTNYKCNEYIQTLNSSIYKEYRNIENLDILIDDWKNIIYWQNLKDKKLNSIVHLTNTLKNIETAVDIFKTNVLDQILKYTKSSFDKDLQKYNKIIQNTHNISFENPEKQEILQEIHQMVNKQKIKVSVIQDSKDIDKLIQRMTDYIYMKSQIEWKLELLATE